MIYDGCMNILFYFSISVVYHLATSTHVLIEDVGISEVNNKFYYYALLLRYIIIYHDLYSA